MTGEGSVGVARRSGSWWRRAGFFAVTCGVAVTWAAGAQAGYAIQPASGSSTGPKPTFVVYLDPGEYPATVYVASTPTMDSLGFPLNELGSCTPTTPFGEANKYTCQPSGYGPTYNSTLAPGTYFWWLVFYKTEPGDFFPSQHVSGPLQFTVLPPTPPDSARLVSPATGASVRLPLRLVAHAPAQSNISFYVSDSTARLDDGSPANGSLVSCEGQAENEDDYICTDDGSVLVPGTTYYWWVVIDTGDAAWIYGPRNFKLKAATSAGSSGATRQVQDAPKLASSMHYREQSVKHLRLSRAAYQLTKILGFPKTIAVACWSPADWPTVADERPDSVYSTLGFYLPLMPHWVHLSPRVCRSMETLIYHRPRYANAITANAVETLTHEMMHALGIRKEAMAECFGMQLSIVMAVKLGVPPRYADSLARLTLGNYNRRPPSYIDRLRCRENGQWDIFPNRNSPPWHTYRP